MRKLLILLAPLFRPLFFWLGYGLLRSPFYRRNNKVHKASMQLLRLAADLNHTRALSMYGHLLHLHGDSQAGKIQGGIYLERAARKGDVKAQYMMARIYEQGFSAYFTPNPKEALSFYIKAAEQGHPVAASRLAEVYENGELEQAPDPEKAEYWQQQIPGR